MTTTLLRGLSRLRSVPKPRWERGQNPEVVYSGRSPGLPELIKKRDDGLHTIFLEGATGVGSTAVVDRLSKSGFATFKMSFRDFCLKDQVVDPASPVVQMKWVYEMVKQVEDASEQCKSGSEHFRDNILFIDRSPLSSYVYTSNSFWLDFTRDFNKTHNTSMILCEADPYAVALRMAQRVELADPEFRAMGLALGEQDESFQEAVSARYRQLRDANSFDALLDTSVVKLAVMNLFGMLGLPFRFPPNADTPKPSS